MTDVFYEEDIFGENQIVITLGYHNIACLYMHVVLLLSKEGFKEAAEKFRMESGIEPSVDLDSLDERIKIREMILKGQIQEAIALINSLHPELLDTNRYLYFHLQVHVHTVLFFLKHYNTPFSVSKSEFSSLLLVTWGRAHVAMAWVGIEQLKLEKCNRPVRCCFVQSW